MELNSTLESCDSTNRLAREAGAQGPDFAPHGSWISARVQTAGRGRWGRQWESQAGNLFLSVILRPARSDHYTWIPMLSALSTVELLAERWPHLALTIKWPNDIWLDGAKLGGLLCETVASSRHPTFLVLGLGLNVRSAPEGLDQATAALSGSLAGLGGDAGAEACLAELRPLLALHIAGSIERLDREGSGFVRELFWKHAHFKPGALIEWTIPESGAKRHGKVLDLGVHGELQVECAGERVSLYAEEIRGLRSAGG